MPLCKKVCINCRKRMFPDATSHWSIQDEMNWDGNFLDCHLKHNDNGYEERVGNIYFSGNENTKSHNLLAESPKSCPYALEHLLECDEYKEKEFKLDGKLKINEDDSDFSWKVTSYSEGGQKVFSMKSEVSFNNKEMAAQDATRVCGLMHLNLDTSEC